MKTISLFVVSLLLVASLPCIAAINYSISFTGSGASTTVGDVVVQNLTKGTTITVPAGNVLNLSDAPSAVEQLNANDETIRIYPNSVGGASTLSFFAKQAGSTQINVYSLDGRKAVSINQNLQAGGNSFQLSLPIGSYAIQVIGNEYTYSAKMINQSASLSEPEITYIGAEKSLSAAPQKSKSSTLSTTSMTYATGDQLLYIGTSGNYSTVVTDIPTADKIINFDFVACTDADGNNYKVVKIGTQTWMAENLKTTKYNDGTSIPNETDNTAWAALLTPAYCSFSNSATYNNTYGALYNWYTLNTGKLAPAGWHLATDAEWTILENYASANPGTSRTVAKALATTTQWKSFADRSSGSVTDVLTKNNSTGFSASSGGCRLSSGTFYNLGYDGYWWTATEYDTSYAWSRVIDYNKSTVVKYSAYNKTSGYSVRCVKD